MIREYQLIGTFSAAVVLSVTTYFHELAHAQTAKRMDHSTRLDTSVIFVI